MFSHLMLYAFQDNSLPWSGWDRIRKCFLPPSAGNQIRSYDTECPNYHPLLSTLKFRGIELYQDEMVNYIPSSY